nr:hypothetical protein [Lacibacter sp.]
MNADVLNRLLQQPSLLKETTVADLEMMAYQYPWFGTAQLLLAAKQKQTGVLTADQQVQKAMIYFNQPSWLGTQLNRFITAEPISVTAIKETEALHEIDETDAALDAVAMIEAEDIRDKKDNNVLTDASLDAEYVLKADADKEADQFIKELDIEEQAEAMIEADAQREVADFMSNADAEMAADATIDAELAKEEFIKTEEPAAVEEKPVFTFEPFHTVDYFASQGIKMREEKIEGDKLDKQVKSFTQWLRSMKKIYVEEQKELGLTEEKDVLAIATESNQQTEVMTET